jgi:hypothetical protein
MVFDVMPRMPGLAAILVCGLWIGAADAASMDPTAPATFRSVAAFGGPLPGSTTGETVSPAQHAVVNDAGDVAYNASVFDSGGGFVGGAIVTTGGVVIRQGQQAPGAPPGVTLRSLGRVWINASGQIAFKADLTGPGVTPDDNQGIFTADGMVVRKGDALKDPSDPSDPGKTVTLVNLPADTVSINDNGAVAFRGLVSNDVRFFRDDVIYVDDEPVLYRNGPAPGLPPGNTVVAVGAPTLNNAGQVALTATLAGPDVAPGANFATLVAGGGAPARLDTTINTPIPGGGGLEFATLSGRQALNDLGQVATLGNFAPFDFRNLTLGLFVDGELVARDGDPILDPATGDPTGFTLGSRFYGEPALNNGGTAIFNATLAGPGLGLANDSAIQRSANGGPLELLLRSGDLIEIDGVMRTLRLILMNNLSRNTVNAFGDFVFLASFSDQNGPSGGLVLYEAARTAHPVPLPATLWLTLGGIVGFGALGRRRAGRRGPAPGGLTLSGRRHSAASESAGAAARSCMV